MVKATELSIDMELERREGRDTVTDLAKKPVILPQIHNMNRATEDKVRIIYCLLNLISILADKLYESLFVKCNHVDVYH